MAAGLAGALFGLAACNANSLRLGVATALAEKRPGLLRDAQWKDPTTARRFNDRFAAGASERDLLRWLNDNRFAVDGHIRHADRMVASLPCNERITVDWTTNAAGLISRAEATVSEAGCL